jgi:hypothetical protein
VEYLIVVLLANSLGQPVEIGTYNGATYPDLAACDAARPGIVISIQNDIDTNHPGKGFKVVDSKCATKDELNKVNDRARRPPLDGQRDA